MTLVRNKTHEMLTFIFPHIMSCSEVFILHARLSRAAACTSVTSLRAAHLRLGSKGKPCSSQWRPQSTFTGFKQFLNQACPCQGSGELRWMVNVTKGLDRQGIPTRVKKKGHNSSWRLELHVIRCSELRQRHLSHGGAPPSTWCSAQ